MPIPTAEEILAANAAALLSPAEEIRDQDQSLRYKPIGETRAAMELAHEAANPPSGLAVVCPDDVTL